MATAPPGVTGLAGRSLLKPAQFAGPDRPLVPEPILQPAVLEAKLERLPAARHREVPRDHLEKGLHQRWQLLPGDSHAGSVGQIRGRCSASSLLALNQAGIE